MIPAFCLLSILNLPPFPLRIIFQGSTERGRIYHLLDGQVVSKQTPEYRKAQNRYCEETPSGKAYTKEERKIQVTA